MWKLLSAAFLQQEEGRCSPNTHPQGAEHTPWHPCTVEIMQLLSGTRAQKMSQREKCFLSSEPMQRKIWQCPSSGTGIGDSRKPKARQPAPQSTDKRLCLQHTHAQTHNFASSCTHIHTSMYPYAYTHIWD